MRKFLIGSLLSVFALTLLVGCSSTVKLVGAKAEPAVLSPGQKGKLIVILSGAKKKVGSVVAVVREYPEYTVRLNDEGRMGDEKAGDGVWTYEFPVPYDAPAQDYHLDITIRDKDGNIIQVGQAKGPATTIVVKVQ
ncbi:MAG: hypothetical protein GXO73_02070 [Calditrichaeota bacterium]|nr:hypothetical protein [Calditrichota bacterium]